MRNDTIYHSGDHSSYTSSGRHSLTKRRRCGVYCDVCRRDRVYGDYYLDHQAPEKEKEEVETKRRGPKGLLFLFLKGDLI